MAMQNYAKFESRIDDVVTDGLKRSFDTESMDRSQLQDTFGWVWNGSGWGDANIAYGNSIWDTIHSLINTVLMVIVFLACIIGAFYVIYIIISLFSKWGRETMEDIKSHAQRWWMKLSLWVMTVRAWLWLLWQRCIIKPRRRNSLIAIIIIIVCWPLLASLQLVSVVDIDNGSVAVDLQHHRILGPGYHVYSPVLTKLFLARTSVFDFEIAAVTANTKEDMFVEMDYRVGFHMDTTSMIDFYTKYGQQDEQQIASDVVMPRVLETLKAVIKQYSFRDISSNHAEIKQKAIADTNRVLASLGITIDDINLLDIRLPDAYTESVENLTKAENDLKYAEALLLTQKKQSEQDEYKAESEKRIQIIQAEAIAQYNKILSQNPPSAAMIQLRKIDIEKMKINKWNGILPWAWPMSGPTTMAPGTSYNESFSSVTPDVTELKDSAMIPEQAVE